MANKVLLKKSSVAAKVPVVADLDYGELALNYTDEKLYFKNASNAIKSFTAPNDGQLTLAVSGVGLSGSATFTANQSTNSTFTVTSNATSANTASAIVARDASGNFSAGSITLEGSTPRLLANMSGTQSTRLGIQNSTANGNTRFFLYPNGTGTISAINGWNNSDSNATDYQSFDLAVIGTTDVRLSSNAAGTAAFLPITFYTNGTEQMRLNGTGVGINTQTPNSIAGNSNARYFALSGDGTLVSADGRIILVNPQSYANITASSTAGRVYFQMLNASGGATTDAAYIAGLVSGSGGTSGYGIGLAFYPKADNGSSSMRMLLDPLGNLRLSIAPAAINTTTPGTGTYGLNFTGSSSTDNAQGITWSWSGQTAQAGIYVQSSGAYGTKMYIATTDSFATGSKTAVSIDHTGLVNFVRARPTYAGNVILDAGNYNSYSPTLTGTGASGTWGISITGNAATVASLTPNQFFNNMGNNHSTYTDFNSVPNFGVYYVQAGTNSPTGVSSHQWYGFTLGLGNQYPIADYATQLYWPRRAQNSDTYVYVRDREGGSWTGWNKIKAGYADSAGSAGSVDFNNLTNKASGTGTYTTSGDYRAPIFYDSNDTGYYIDPNSTTNSALRMRGGALFGPNTTWSAYLYVGTDGRAGSEATVAVTNGNLHIDSKNGYQLYLNWYSTENIYSQGNFGVGNSSASYRLHVHGTGYATSDFRAPIFYDSNDTAYYVDPASTSRLNQINYTNIYLAADTSYGFIGSSIYVDTINSGYAGDQLEFNYVRGTWAGISHDSLRAPIFYDYNDTAYYTDPASTSQLNYSVVRNLISVEGYRFTNPQGATYFTTSSTVTGAIKIQLPADRRYANSMLQFKVKVYEYTTGYTHEFIISGYNYSYWVNVAATQITDAGRSALTVRWGDDGTYNCVWIGETNTSWSYPQVFITDVQIGYSGVSNNWGAGWGVTFVTSFNTVDTSRTASMVKTVNNASNWGYADYATIFYDSNNTGYYLDPTSASTSLNIAGGITTPTMWVNYATSNNNNYNENIRLFAATNGVAVIAFGASGTGGTPWNSLLGYSDRLEVRQGDTWIQRNYNNHVEANGSFRAPIFYDSNNTGYYVDPVGTARLNTIYGGDVYLDNGGWFRNYNNTGIYNQTHGNHFYATSDAYWNVGANNGSVSGIILRTGGHQGTIRGYLYSDSSNNIGFLNSGGSWRARVVEGDYFLGDGSSIRGQLFYDSNNTGYYWDGASTSKWNESNQDGWHSFNNYGLGVTGTYDSTRLQTVFAMGSSYRMAADGTATSNMYGIAWSHPNAGTLGGANNLNDHGILIINNGGFRAAISSRAVFSADVRGTLFYDYNDTNYYCDPASTSYLNSLYIAGGVGGLSNSSSYTEAAIEVRERGFGGAQDDTWATAPRIGFHWGGRVASQIAMNSNGRITILNNPGNATEAFESGNFYAPIFYDSNDTSYYVDPASTSLTNDFRANIFYDRADTNYYAQPRSISYFNDFRPNIIYDRQDTSYYLDGNSTSRLYYVVPNKIKLVNIVNNEPRWDFSAYVVEAQHWYGNDASQTMYLGESGNAIQIPSSSGIRPTIMYDYNDTTYYIDPNASTALRTVGDWRANSADWSGEFSGKIQYHSSIWYFQAATGFQFRSSAGSQLFYCDSSGNVTATGNVTAYSDVRLKKNIQTIEKPLEIVSRLRGVTFDWIESGEHSYGLIAQEVEQVLPELVVENVPDPNSVDKDKISIKSVDYSKMVSVLIEAIKEQDDKIARLEALVEKLLENKP